MSPTRAGSIGKFSELLNFTIASDQLDEYFDMLERERRRAWRKYDMLVMTGLEFNKEGFTKKTSGHLLGIDLKAPITPSLGFRGDHRANPQPGRPGGRRASARDEERVGQEHAVSLGKPGGLRADH